MVNIDNKFVTDQIITIPKWRSLGDEVTFFCCQLNKIVSELFLIKLLYTLKIRILAIFVLEIGST